MLYNIINRFFILFIIIPMYGTTFVALHYDD